LKAPGHMLHEARFAASRGPFEEYGQLIFPGSLKNRDFIAFGYKKRLA